MSVPALTGVDLPQDLTLTEVESIIVQKVAAGSPVRSISTELGIPTAGINRFLAKDLVQEYIKSLIQARNVAIRAYLPSLLSGIIEDRIQKIEDDPEASLGSASSKDIIEIAKVLETLTKDTSTSKEDEKDGLGAFYQQVNILQNK